MYIINNVIKEAHVGDEGFCDFGEVKKKAEDVYIIVNEG